MRLGDIANPGAAGSGKPLDGVRILALEQMQALPYATQLLARLGAEVVKVEHPKGGDLGRGSTPAMTDPEGRSVGATFLRNNLNKRSICIDLKSPRGRDLVLRLAPRFDVVAENSKAGSMARLGLGYEDIAAVHPGVVYLSVSGFGNTVPSPYDAWPAFAPIVEAMSGIYDFKQQGDAPPLVAPVGALGDIGSALYAVIGVLAALRHRDATGRGQAIDMALLDTQVAMLANLGAGYLATGIAPERAGNAHQNIVPYQVFEVADGHLILAVGNDRQFAKFCAIAGRPELAQDERFARNAGRVSHRATLVPLLAAVMKQRSRRDWLEALEAAHVPCGPINDLAEVFADPHVRSRGMTVDVPHPLAGSVRLVASPIKLSATPVRYRSAPPLLGADTEAVLRELGLAAAEIEELRAAGAI
jgi:crotonobetainyl-CoA:carnitine CoA-transferase CaiB-like acyl-CoA transferase